MLEEKDYTNSYMTFDVIENLIKNPVDPKDVVFKPTDAVKEAVDKFFNEFRNRSFSGRHPELGKMINCPVCRSRHRSSIECKQKFAVAFIDVDPETGEQDVRYRLAPKTRNGVHGAKQFKGRRLRSHLNKRAQKFIERVRQLFTADIEPDNPLFDATLKMARTKATRELREEYRETRRTKNRQRDISRRINNGHDVQIENRNHDGSNRSVGWVRHIFKIGKPEVDRAKHLSRIASASNGEMVQQKEG